VSFTEIMEHVARGFEGLSAIVLVVGLVWAAAGSIAVWRRDRDGRAAYRALRETFGGVLLLALEILVAADLLLSVAVEPTPTNIATLGLLVLVRTVLSFSLEIELKGYAPWRRPGSVRERR